MSRILSLLILMLWHSPAFSGGSHLPDETARAFSLALQRYGADHVLQDTPETDGVFGDLIRARFSCLPSMGTGTSQTVANDIFARFGGPPNTTYVWEDGRYLATGGCQYKNCDAKGVVIMDLQNAQFTFAYLHYYDMFYKDKIHNGMPYTSINETYKRTGYLSVFMEPEATTEFEAESKFYIQKWASYFERPIVDKMLAGDIPFPVEVPLNSSYHPVIYEKQPPMDIHTIACDLDPNAVEKWQDLITERNKAYQ